MSASVRARAALVALAALLAACTSSSPKAPEARRSPLPLLVLDAPSAASWVRLVRAGGAAARSGPVDQLGTRTAAVAPTGSVDAADATAVVAWVQGGGRLATSDPALLTALGVALDPAQQATGLQDAADTQQVVWRTPTAVQPVGAGPGGREVRVTTAEGAALAVSFHVGDGAVWALGVDPFAQDRDGHELLPGLGRDVAAWTGAPAGPARQGLEVYLDPGGLHGADKGSPEELAARLQGVRAVHVAGWNGDFNDPADDYDYAALIEALHARGILAYAWLEPPFVSLRMWEQHPECREKTQTGRDAHVDWRLLIALEDPDCFALATAVWDELLTAFDWDGVNVAELYFESPAVPADHTPFSQAALEQFGGDPLAEPARFLDFRTDLATRLVEQVLRHLNGLPGAARLEFQVTAIDDQLDPALARQVGSSLSRLAAVARRQGAALQVEDPYSVWSRGPLRYDGLATAAARLVPPGATVVDLNVVDREGARPTSAMTGAELDLAASAAGTPSGRVAVYALGTLRPDDLARLPAAVAGAVQTVDTGVVAPWAVVVTAPPGARGGAATVDGVPWPVARGRAVVPAGEHRVVWEDAGARGPGLLAFSGELGEATVSSDGLTLGYDARARAYAVLTCRPTLVGVDGADVDPDHRDGTEDGTWVLRLPKGTHRVVVRC